jgi:intracellular sulfur oxidation DsrE/DsrF family protein
MWNKIVPATCVVAALMVAPCAWGEGIAPKGGADGRHRVVMHLNSGDEKVQKGALNNIKHLYQELGGDHVTVELVVHGAGLELLTKKGTKFGEELERLHGLYGVSYTACSNTMKAMNVTKADLIDQVARTVPAMVRLMELQEAGWAYIKP